MTDDRPGGEDERGDGTRKPPSDHHEIVLAINALNTKYESAQTHRAQHDQKTLFWGRIAGIGVSIYVVLTLVIMLASIYSAHISNRSYVSSQRAFVSLELLAGNLYIDRDNLRWWHPNARIANRGNTPTKDMSYALACTLSNKELSEPFDEDKLRQNLVPSFSVPARATAEPVEICHLRLKDVTQESQHLYVFGRARYHDIIDPTKDHVTEFCAEEFDITEQIASNKPTPKGTPARPALRVRTCPGGHHNCNDEECNSQK